MKFRLNAGRPAPSFRGGPSARPAQPETPILPKRWAPNEVPDTALHCGCKIPWPVLTLLGSGGQVWCDTHGWQHVTKKETDQAKQHARKDDDTCPAQLDLPPF